MADVHQECTHKYSGCVGLFTLDPPSVLMQSHKGVARKDLSSSISKAGLMFVCALNILQHFFLLCREMDPPPARRQALPTPKQKDDNSSIWSIMWSILKESLGKDLTHITLPFFFNEPLSVLQKTMEDLEYANLLNKVYKLAAVMMYFPGCTLLHGQT